MMEEEERDECYSTTLYSRVYEDEAAYIYIYVFFQSNKGLGFHRRDWNQTCFSFFFLFFFVDARVTFDDVPSLCA